jgi:putative ABC transport system permease protein
MAVAILIVGRFGFDAIEYLIRVQFGAVQREDVMVSFFVARPDTAVQELANLPGVLRVEPFRVVPVRLVHEHRSKRMALVGIPANADLRRLIDRKEDVVPLPPDGLVITSYLAQTLGLEKGEMVTVEVLDESRPTTQIPLSGTIDDLLGVSAYIDLHALNRMMGEGRNVSGAHLLVDSAEKDELYDRLKRIPAVSGVAIQEAMLQSFRETIAQSMGMSNVTLIVFACIIAMGVVYNGARIALSERGRELASLRVLGFTRGEVSAMLLGEQALLTALAIPVGFVIGYFLSALVSRAYQSDLYRFPLIITAETWAFSFVVITVAAVISGVLVYQRIKRLDLVEVLKTRE